MERNYFISNTEPLIRREDTHRGLQRIYRRVSNSKHSRETKDYLMELIKQKQGIIDGKPQFREINGKMVLLDESLYVYVAASKFSALIKLISLFMRGHRALIYRSGIFYRIRLRKPSKITITEHQAIS